MAHDQTYTIEEWLTHIDENVREERKRTALRRFVENAFDRSIPVVFTLQHLSLLVGITAKSLAAMINQSESFYRQFEIPKRDGTKRAISVPYPSLLKVQRWIHSNILQRASLSDYAHGFVKGRSIVTNALPHLGEKCLLKMDVQAFFPTIQLARVISVFRNLGYPHNVSYNLARLCCHSGVLPQGAATSPAISNIVSRQLDNRLVGLGRAYELTYTRYADDLAFSGSYIPHAFIALVSKILNDEGFTPNESKTRLIIGTGKKIVTGISVGGHSLKLPKASRRKFRQEMYYLSKYGFFGHTEWIGSCDPMYAEALLGKFLFWRHIEPENLYVTQSIERIKAVQAYLDHLEGDG